jgi:alpha-L-rhamnosidase
MGLLHADDWKAQWIGAPWQGESPRREPKPMTPGMSFREYMVLMNQQEPAEPAPLLRKQFEVEGTVKQAKVFVTGLGYFELYVNGQKIGDDCLVPAFTDYTHREALKYGMLYPEYKNSGTRVVYLAYDVTEQIISGANVIGGIVGDGFYDTTSQWDCSFGSARFLCQLELTMEDDTKQVVISDNTWQAKQSAIRMNGVFDGEIYDARYETPLWATAQCDMTDDWQPVALRQAPDGKLVANMVQTDKVVEQVKPVSLSRQEDGTYLVDFGVENSGWIRFTGIKGQAGDTLKVDYINVEPNGTEQYVFKGDAEGENYAPRFTWYVFRQAVISGVNDLTAEQLVQEKVNTAVETIAEWETSNKLFNTLNEMWQRTQTDNMHGGIASDCPHRERSPYTGDAQVVQVTVMHNFDTEAFYRKWIEDMRLSQDPETGYVPNGAPWQPRCGGGVAWGAAMNIMPWEFYLHYGDVKMLRNNFEAMKAQMNHMLQQLTLDNTMLQRIGQGGGMIGGNEEGNYWLNLGDWCPPNDIPNKELVHTFYLWRCADYTARAAHVLGDEVAEATYRKLAEETKDAFHRKFYQPATKSYGLNGSNVFALKMGVPEDVKADVVETLRREIIEDNNGHLNTGIFGTQFLFEVLADVGLNDVAYTVMDKRTFPSYGYWVEQGATTFWEHWDNRQASQNHPMFGGGLTWFYRWVTGMQTDETQPGFRHIVLRPQLPAGLDFARYATLTPYGRVESAVRRNGASLTLKATIPVGSHATICLPAADVQQITENGQPLANIIGIEAIEQTEAGVKIEVAQGSYNFCCNLVQ